VTQRGDLFELARTLEQLAGDAAAELAREQCDFRQVQKTAAAIAGRGLEFLWSVLRLALTTSSPPCAFS
jgi:hypothetical protein